MVLPRICLIITMYLLASIIVRNPRVSKGLFLNESIKSLITRGLPHEEMDLP